MPSNAHLLRVADAVVDALNRATLSRPHVAERVYLPVLKRDDLDALRLQVIPVSWDTKLLTRNHVERTATIHVGIVERLTAETNAAIDPLVAFLAEIEEYFETHRRPDDNLNAVYIESETLAAPLDFTELENNRLFQGVLALKFRMLP